MPSKLGKCLQERACDTPTKGSFVAPPEKGVGTAMSIPAATPQQEIRLRLSPLETNTGTHVSGASAAEPAPGPSCGFRVQKTFVGIKSHLLKILFFFGGKCPQTGQRASGTGVRYPHEGRLVAPPEQGGRPPAALLSHRNCS